MTGGDAKPVKAPQASQARPALRARTPLSLRDISPRSGESPLMGRLLRGQSPREKPPLTGEVAERQRWPEGLFAVRDGGRCPGGMNPSPTERTVKRVLTQGCGPGMPGPYGLL